MSKLAIQRTNVGAGAFEWATTPPRLVDGECDWTQERTAARDFADVPGDVFTAWLPCIVGADVQPVWFDNNPQQPVDDREEKRDAALSTLVIERAKAGDAEALAAVEVRASRGDAAAAEYLAEEQRKAEEAARTDAPAEEPARTR